MHRELPDDVRALIHQSVPTVDALEILLLLAASPTRAWSVAELRETARLDHVAPATIQQYLALLHTQELVALDGERCTWSPAPARQAAVAALVTAYNEQPVTLIRTVYAIADSRRIQSFADAFRLRKDR